MEPHGLLSEAGVLPRGRCNVAHLALSTPRCARPADDDCGGEPLTGPSLKLVVTRAAPHTVVGVHIYGEDACELIHFGTTLVQEAKHAQSGRLGWATTGHHGLLRLHLKA